MPANSTAVGSCIDKYPIYLRVADSLESRIARQRPGALLASENELAREYDVSRLTARAALEELERRYLVYRTQGRGTFVAERLDYLIGPETPPSFSQKVRLAGGRPRTETVALRRRPAPAGVRAEFGLGKGARAWFLARRRFVNDRLAAYAETWLDERLLPDLDARLAANASLGAVLDRDYGLETYSAKQRAEFAIAPPAIARKLEQDGRPMVFRLEGTVASRTQRRPVETTISYLRADLVRVVFQMGAAS